MSDQDNTIFNGTPDLETPAVAQPAAVATSTTVVNEPTDLLAQITAEDGRQKYTSVNDALKGLQHSQSHIKNLEKELAELREAATKQKGVEEILEKITNTNKEQETPATPQLDVNVISSLIEQTLEQRAQKTTKDTNITTVISSMKSVFGEEAEKIFIKAAADNGLSVAQMNNLAAVSPNAVLKLVGVGETKPPTIPSKPTNVINTQALPSTKQQNVESLKVPAGARTRDVTSAWKAAGEAIKSN